MRWPQANRCGLAWPALLLVAGAGFPQDAGPRADPDVTPAQFSRPPAAAAVPDPPSPVVRVQVRVPSHAAPGKDVTYRLFVANTSQADAFRVVVRNPIPAGVAQVVTADPKPDRDETKPGQPTGAREVAWNIGTLRAGEKREIELTLRPTAEAKEVRNQAYVSFEHGQSVVTRIDRPKLMVRKDAPKEAAAGDPVAVRVEVANGGKVAMTNVELVENVGKGLTFDQGTGGEKGASPDQRVWRIGRLLPGERKLVEYRVTPKDGGELLTSSAVRSTESPEAERAESSTKVLVPALALELTGPATAAAGESAQYEFTVRNTGTLPLSNVRVNGLIPAECTPTRMTNGGLLQRGQVTWLIPRLDPGAAQSYRLGLKGQSTGRRSVRGTVRDSRGLEKSQEVQTAFQGAAVLMMRARFDATSITVGRQGLLTVDVTNEGTDAAKDARLRIELPPEVRFVQATPKQFQAAASEVIFDAAAIPANRTETFTLTYRADKAAQAWFRLKLSADSLGDRPLEKTQAVEISGLWGTTLSGLRITPSPASGCRAARSGGRRGSRSAPRRRAPCSTSRPRRPTRRPSPAR